ncbi:uncharacterized protein LOC141684828 [Apium graveolens]|uniref:uncharacterized protein LOC141684828 n=1 Tax=Apium graveolens TaxID=4045 RepID=UPI003D791F22
MANQPRQQQHFSRLITATNRRSVNDQAARASFNHPVHPVQMASANLVIQGQINAMTSTHDGPLEGRSKRPRVSTENEVNNESYGYFRIPDYAPQNIKDEMLRIRETSHKLFEQSKMLRMQFADKQNEAVKHLVERARSPVETRLKEREAEIVALRKWNTEVREDAENLRRAKKSWMEHAIRCEIEATILRNELEAARAEVRRLQGLVPPNVAVEALPLEQDGKSNCAGTVSRNNTQRNAQGCVRVKVEDGVEIAAEKVPQTGASTVERGEGSGKKEGV